MTSFCSRAKGKVSAGISPTLFFSQATPFFYQLFNPWEVHVGGRVIYSRQIKVLPEPPSTFFPLPKTGTAPGTSQSIVTSPVIRGSVLEEGGLGTGQGQVLDSGALLGKRALEPLEWVRKHAGAS